MSDPVKAHLRSSKSRKKRAHQNQSIFHQNCALHRDAVTGDLFSIDQLLRSKCNVDEVNKAGSSGLHFAAQNGNTDVAIKLLVANANPSLCNKFNETPLHLAVKKGFDEVAYHLLRNNSVVDVANTTDAATPLYYAVTKGYSECVRLLVRAGANPHFVITTTGESILQLACNGTNVETMRQITEVVNVNATLQNGRTALHWACYYGKMAFVRQLLHRGASVHVVDEEGCTPLFWAVYSGHANVVRALLRHGADTEAKAADGSRPIHWAATYDHPTICEMLLMDNCNVNAMYNYGMTALHHAAELGFDQIVTVLLAHGADVNLRVQDRTVQELAADKQHKRVLQLLDDADTLIAERKLTFIPLAQLTVEQIAGFLNTKHLTMFVDKFADLQIDGKKASELWSSRSNAGVFMQSIAKDTVKRFKTLCQQGMYNISDAKRGGYKLAMKQYEAKLSNVICTAIERGVNIDEVDDEAFSLKMERAYEARRIFHEADVDHSGYLDQEEVAALGNVLGFDKKVVAGYISEFDTNNDGEMSVEEFVSFFNLMKQPNKQAKIKLEKRIKDKSSQSKIKSKTKRSKSSNPSATLGKRLLSDGLESSDETKEKPETQSSLGTVSLPEI